MVDYSLLVPIILFLIVTVIAFKIIKGFVKLAIFLIGITSLAIGIGSFLVISDMNELRDIGEGRNLVIVADTTEVVTAIELEGDKQPKIINDQQTEAYGHYLSNRDFASIREDYYKLIIIDVELLSEYSGDPQLIDDLKTEKYSEEKLAIVAPILQEVFTNPLFLITQYKKGNVVIYEETAIFKVIKLVPDSVVELVVSKLIDRPGVESEA